MWENTNLNLITVWILVDSADKLIIYRLLMKFILFLSALDILIFNYLCHCGQKLQPTGEKFQRQELSHKDKE